MKSIPISVVMRVFNGQAFLSERLRAFLARPTMSHVEQIDREILEKLDVGNVEIEENVLGGYRHLRNILEDAYPEAALGAMNGILALYNSGTVGRREAADTWLKAAGMHYRLGRPLQALFCANHGILTRPTIVGRPLRTALVRSRLLPKMSKGKRYHTELQSRTVSQQRIESVHHNFEVILPFSDAC